MTTLDRRDRRRALKIVNHMNAEPNLSLEKVLALIAAALKHERKETTLAAATWFLFSGKNERARVKRAVSKPGAQAAFASAGKR